MTGASAPAPAAIPTMQRAGAAAPTGGIDLTPSQRDEQITRRFLSALGNPSSVAEYDAAVERAVVAIAGRDASGGPDYVQFNRVVENMSPAARASFYIRSFAATAAAVPGKPDGIAGGRFASNVRSVQDPDAHLVAPRTRSAHPNAVSTVAQVRTRGDVPAELATAAARIRIGPGTNRAVPGVGIAFIGPEGDSSRVFASFGGKSYDTTLSTRLFGISTAGPEGDLEFVPGPQLRKLELLQNGKASTAWMEQAAALPAGTVLGTVQPPDGSWSIEIVLGDTPLTHNLFAERSTRFPRQLSGANVLGSFLLGTIKVMGALVRFFTGK